MRHNERAVYLIHPSLWFPSESELSFPLNATAAAKEAEESAKPAASPRLTLQQEQQQQPQLPLQEQQMQEQRKASIWQQVEEIQKQLRQNTQQLDPETFVTLTGNDWLVCVYT